MAALLTTALPAPRKVSSPLPEIRPEIVMVVPAVTVSIVPLPAKFRAPIEAEAPVPVSNVPAFSVRLSKEELLATKALEPTTVTALAAVLWLWRLETEYVPPPDRLRKLNSPLAIVSNPPGARREVVVPALLVSAVKSDARVMV